jgi:hypothetical protein
VEKGLKELQSILVMDANNMTRSWGWKVIETPDYEDSGPRVLEHLELMKLYESKLTVPEEHEINERLFISLGDENIELNPNPSIRQEMSNFYRQLIAHEPSWKEQLEVELVYSNRRDKITSARKILTENIYLSGKQIK